MNATNWKFGLSIGFERGDEFKKFEACAVGGVDVVEVSLNERLYPDADWQAIADASKQTGLPIWSVHLPFYPFVSIDPASLDPAVRASTLALHKQGVENAALLGAKVVIVHPSAEPNADDTRKERLAYAGEHLCRLADYAAQYGITVAAEDLPRTCLGNCAADIQELIAGDARLGVCFDTNHLLTERNVDFVKALGSRIVTTHVSDYDYCNERHWLPYEGRVDWIAVVSALEAAGYEGPFLYELGLKAPPTITRPRDLTYADLRENFSACTEKRPYTPIGVPDVQACAQRAYFETPRIKD